MTTIDRVRNVPTIVLAGQGLKDVAYTAQGVDDAGKTFSLLGYGLQALGVKVQTADPRADLRLVNQLAAATRSLADFRSGMPGGVDASDPSSSDGIRRALGTAFALDSLSDGIARTARSIPVGNACGAIASDSRSTAMTLNYKADARDVAFQARNLADLIMDGVGLNFRDPADTGDVIPVDACGCASGAVASRLPDIGGVDLASLRSATLADHKQVQAGLAMVDALAPRVTTVLDRTGDALCDGPVEVGFCDDKCTPAGSLIGLKLGKISAPRDKSGTRYVPTFEVDWTLCCTDSCLLVFDQNVETIVMTIHTATPLVPTNRPIGAARNVANKAGDTEVKNFQASVAPGGPAYAPAAGIAPALAIPACPP